MSDAAVSLSLDETNANRIALGLAPLNPNAEDKTVTEDRVAVDNAHRARRQRDSEKEQEAQVTRIQQARENRLYKQSLQSTSIVDDIEKSGDKAASSAADWVKQSRLRAPSRKKEVQAAVEAANTIRKRTRDGDLSEDSTTAGGLLIQHDADEFEMGETRILTLADKRIDGDEELGDHEDDELQDLDKIDQKKLDRNLGRKKKKPKYDVFAERKQNVLPQYDEEKDELAAEKGGVRLDDAGQFGSKRSKNQSSHDSISKRLEISLDSKSIVNSEYMTNEETISFKKPRRKVEKHSSMKRKTKTMRANSAAFSDSSNEPISGFSADHGSRASGGKARLQSIRRSADDERRRQRFANALSKADERSHTLLTKSKELAELDASLLEEDSEDKVLQASLDRARRTALQKKPRGPAAVLSAVKNNLPKNSIKKEHEQLTFTAASEFRTNLDLSAAELRERRRSEKKKAKEKAARALQDVMDAEEREERKRRIIDEHERTEIEMDVGNDSDEDEVSNHRVVKTEKAEDVNDDSDHHDDNGDNEINESSVAFLQESEGRLSSGVSAAIQHIRNRGWTKSTQEPVYIGRASDMSIVREPDEADDKAPQIKLNRANEHGQRMSIKQQFRELSYKFHGQTPGAKKREKLAREYEQQIQRQAVSGTNVGVGLSERLRETTARTGRAYVVIGSQGGAHGDVATAKMEIGAAAEEFQKSNRMVATAPFVPERRSTSNGAYVSGSKKVEFEFSKAK